MKWKLEVLSPVHIGTGEQFSQFDYAYDGRDQSLIMIDFDKALERPEVNADELSKAMRNRNFRMDEFLSKQKVDLRDVEKYRLPCKSDPGNAGLRAQIKDIYGNPYIPGSSIKGAIRTAYFWTILDEDDDIFYSAESNLNSVLSRRGRVDNRRVDDSIEKKIFGKNPNFDLFRSVQVSDSKSIDQKDCLEAGEIWTYTLNRNDKLVPKRERNREYKIFVEQLKPGTDTNLNIKIDEYLFSQDCAELGFENNQDNVHDFANICNYFAKYLINYERSFYNDYGLDDIVEFYEQLKTEVDLDSNNEFLLCIGWGGGYETKTVTDLFREDEENFDFYELRKKLRLGKSRSGNYYDPVFPKTRRLATERGVATCPLGWLKFTIAG